MSKPIDTNSAVGLSQTDSAAPTEGAGDVEQTTKAFRSAMADAAAVDSQHGIDAAVSEAARQLHRGTLSPADAPGAVIDAMVDARFSNLSPQERGAMKQALRDALLSDTYFMIELESALGQALMRVE